MELLDETAPEAVIPDLNAEAFYQEYTFGDLKVAVSYEAGTVPEGTEVIVTDAKPEAVEAIKVEKGEGIRYVGADISFVFEGKEIEPKDFSDNKVSVTLEYVGEENLTGAGFETLHVNETLSEDGTVVYGVETVNASMEDVTKTVTKYTEMPVYETREITEERTTMVTKTREVEKTKTVKVKVKVKWYDPSTWAGYKYETQKYTVTETYEEPVTETVVVGTEEVQVGTETVEDGTEEIVVGQKAVFEVDDFSTYAIVVTQEQINSGSEYVIFTTSTHRALTNANPPGQVAITVSEDGKVNSDNDNIKWVFEETEETNGGYYIYYNEGNNRRYLRDNSGNNNNNTSSFTTTTNSTNSRIVWTFSGQYLQNVATSRYLTYNNNFSLDRRINNATAITIAEVQVPAITIHYVDESGVVLQPNSTMPAPSNQNGYTNPYDVVATIAGSTYHNTFIGGYTAETGTQIIPEFVTINGSWNYVNYGLEGWSVNDGPNYGRDAKYHSISGATDIYVVYGDPYAASSSGGSGGGGGGETPDMTPQAGKNLTPNNDGTYTLSLSITGKGASDTDATGANVIMVFDTSSSMTRYNTDGTENQDAYHPPADADTRLKAAKLAAQDAATELLGQNTAEEPDLVELYLIDFNYKVTKHNKWYTQAGETTGESDTDFNALVEGLWIDTGTNWEESLQAAYEVAQEKAETDDDPTYIIFITDGNPSARKGTEADYGRVYSGEPTTSTTNINATSNSDYTYYNRNNNYLRATDDARTLVQAGYTFYSIGIYGNVDVLEYLTNFAYTGRSNGNEKDTIHEGTEVTYNHYFPASSTDLLNEALSAITEIIKKSISLAGVSFDDGIATDVTTTTLSTNAGGTISGVTYRKTGGETGSFTVTVDDDGTPQFQIGTDTTKRPGTTIKNHPYKMLVEQEQSDGTIKVVEQDATADIYSLTYDNETYQMAIATFVDGDLKWDLSPLGTLEDGATYRISMIVWPDQDAYDYVANLNNKIDGYTWNEDEAEPVMADDGVTILYYKGGVTEFPNIVRYENGTFAALTNTHQNVKYYIANTEETEGGGTVTTYSVGPEVPLVTPKPADLTSTVSKITKKWNAEMAKNQLVSFLYNTYTGESLEKAITFQVYEDDEPYTTTTLGWIADDEHPDGGYYNWADETETISYYGIDYEIGSVWKNDFAIATGIMLNEVRMNALGLDKTKYQSVEYGSTKYYILEFGHDYKVDEPTLSYSFDFVNKTYHPMLVNGDLKNVFFEYGDGVDESGHKIITGITDVEDMEDGIRVDNTLRGGINLDKVVQDSAGKEYATDDKFVFDVQLQNSTMIEPEEPGQQPHGVFYGDNTPWYAINGLYYHDAEWNLYSASSVNYDVSPRTFVLKDEAGNTYDATSFDFHETIGPATVTFTKDGEEVTIQLYGNALTPNDDGTVATGTVSISQTDSLRIANIPIGTTYSITESTMIGYELDEITREIVIDANDPNPYEESDGIDVLNRVITGEIVANRQNNIKFINRIKDDDAFYVYHSANRMIEKILFADERVQKTYVEATTVDEETTPAHYEYTFNIVEEAGRKKGDTDSKAVAVKGEDGNATYYFTGGFHYGGYFKAYGGAGMTDKQIICTDPTDEGNAVYDKNWATDENGVAYDGKLLKPAGKTNRFWTKTDAYTAVRGDKMVPEVNGVYYLKEVPVCYLQTNARWVYDTADSNKILNIYLLTCLDDTYYKEAGFTVVTSETKSVNISSTFTYQNRGETTVNRVTVPNLIGQRGYMGVVNITDQISAVKSAASATEGIIVKPYWKTFDSVKIATLGYSLYNTGSGELTNQTIGHTGNTEY